MQNKKGFTIIELLVVIAIIAVLAAIVLVNVTQYINKGKDAAARGNLATLSTNSAIWIDGGGTNTLANFLASSGGTSVTSALTTAGYTSYTGTPTTLGWLACVQLKADTAKYYCVDSSGNKKETTGVASTACVEVVIACP